MPPPGENLTGIDYFFLVVPVTLALFAWIAAVMWVSYRRDVRHVGDVTRDAMARGPGSENRTGERPPGGGRPGDRTPGQSTASPAGEAGDDDLPVTAGLVRVGAVPWPREEQARPPRPEPAQPASPAPAGSRSASGRGR
jgi:hypothetical protein